MFNINFSYQSQTFKYSNNKWDNIIVPNKGYLLDFLEDHLPNVNEELSLLDIKNSIKVNHDTVEIVLDKISSAVFAYKKDKFNPYFVRIKSPENSDNVTIYGNELARIAGTLFTIKDEVYIIFNELEKYHSNHFNQ